MSHYPHLLAPTMGNLDDAATHFEDALASCRKAGYRPKLAWSLCDYADIVRERDRYGIRNLPTLLVFKGGERVDQVFGARPKAELKRTLEKVIAS